MALCLSLVACGGKNSEEETVKNRENDYITILEATGKAKITLLSYEIIKNPDGNDLIAFTMLFTNKDSSVQSFNDICNKANGILHFSQNGTKLEPRYTDKTSNISIELPTDNSVEVTKAFELVNSSSDIDIVLADADGAAYSSYSLKINSL